MINRHDMFMVKVAAMTWDEWQKERRKRLNIRKALIKQQPKTYKQRQIEQLTGRQYTPGQIARGGAIGAGVGMAGTLLTRGIEHGKGALKSALRSPRTMGASAVRGALIGAAIPSLKRRADVSAAEGGWY